MPLDATHPKGAGTRARVWLSGAIVLALVVGVSWRASSTATSPSSSTDSPSAKALARIATTFNDNYQANRVGAVYDRFDAVSRRVISRAHYLRDHLECPNPPGPATVTSVMRARDGYWIAHYVIGGVGLNDYWHYEGGRWLFSLVKSNPGALALYRMPFDAYARAVGCTPGA